MDKEKNDETIHAEEQLASWVNYKLKQAMMDKQDYVDDWTDYMKAYNNENWLNQSQPDYKSNVVSNYIFGTVETIRPIMLDNNPRCQVIPRIPDGVEKADAVQTALDYEFDRERVSAKLSAQLINLLVYGTMCFYLGWDGEKKQITFTPVNIFNIFPDPLATCVEDAEYIIYAQYMHVNKLKEMFPDKAKKLIGSDISYSELVNENNMDATKINNQVLVCEMWVRDYTTIEIEEGDNIISKKKYPNGRVITACPELGIILSDKKNPFKDGRFPFFLVKDFDIPFKFWGDGEVKRLLSPQENMNDLNNSIIDNAKATANMPWIIDKNAGIAKGKITNRPGLVIRKNPGSEVRREQPPSMPVYVSNKVLEFKEDMEQISGVFDTLRGNSEKGVYTAQGLLALQEAGQARIRLKVKNLEAMLGEMFNTWYYRMKQFWKDDRYVSVVGKNGQVDFKQINKDIFEYDFEIKIIAGSTMMLNKGALLDIMIRLAQTPAEDGMPVVDREAILEYVPSVDGKEVLKRYEAKQQEVQKQQINEQQHQAQHQEMQAILKDLVAQVQEMNKVLSDVQKEMDTINDENELEKIKDKSYNEGYTDSENLIAGQQQMQEQNNQQIPDEVLQQISELDDTELMELLQTYPQLEELIKSEMQLNNMSNQNLEQSQQLIGNDMGQNAMAMGNPQGGMV